MRQTYICNKILRRKIIYPSTVINVVMFFSSSTDDEITRKLKYDISYETRENDCVSSNVQSRESVSPLNSCTTKHYNLGIFDRTLSFSFLSLFCRLIISYNFHTTMYASKIEYYVCM